MASNLPVMWKIHVRSLIQEDPLEKGMASHSSTLAWRMPQTEETDGLQSQGRKESDMTEQVTHKRARRENGMFEAEERCLSAIFQPGLPDKILGTEVPSSKNLEPKYKAKTHGSSGTNGLMILCTAEMLGHVTQRKASWGFDPVTPLIRDLQL